MKNNTILISLASIILSTHSRYAQNAHIIAFKASYKTEGDSDHIKLIAENLSGNKTYYYVIGVMGQVDTGWTGLCGDIGYLGQKDMLTLKPIKPKARIVDIVSKKEVMMLYGHKKIKRIRFVLTYFTSKEFNSKSEEIDLEPI